jgi:transposase InsO family protein
MGVTRSSYYEWLHHPECNRVKQDKELIMLIKDIFTEGRGNYGCRTIKKKLEQKDNFIGRRRVARLMNQENLICRTRKKFKATTDSNHTLPIAPNLLNREFQVDRPNICYVGDITYIATAEGWLYLATVIDLYSRKVVGWSMADNMKAELVNKALLMAIWQRKPPKGLVWHTDRGSQYASHSHLKIIEQHGISQSMSRKGNCWDNAVAESFFYTLKNELIYQCKFKTREEAKNVIFEYIEVFYNRIRAHSTNDYLSPVEYENIQKIA